MSADFNKVIVSETTSEPRHTFNDFSINELLVGGVLAESSTRIISSVWRDIKFKGNNTAKLPNSVHFTSAEHFAESFENEIIKKQKMILSLLKSDDYVEGEITKTQLYFESISKENLYVFREVFQRTWLELFRKKNAYALRKFICIASCLEYEQLGDKADAIIIAASVHEDKFVNEASLRAAEAWGEPELVLYLENIRDFSIKWLNDYKTTVIDYLRSRG